MAKRPRTPSISRLGSGSPLQSATLTLRLFGEDLPESLLDCNEFTSCNSLRRQFEVKNL